MGANHVACADVAGPCAVVHTYIFISHLYHLIVVKSCILLRVHFDAEMHTRCSISMRGTCARAPDRATARNMSYVHVASAHLHLDVTREPYCISDHGCSQPAVVGTPRDGPSHRPVVPRDERESPWTQRESIWLHR